MVYVLDLDGQPLMPTNRHGKIRHLLKDGLAEVVMRCPFTIRLLYDSTCYTQEVVLGVDTGSKHIGLSATTETKELYASDVELRNDIVDLLSTRRQSRRFRRNRKTRYRKARFKNRVSSKKEGWIAPSVQQKIDTHLTVVSKVCRMLPVTRIVVETAAFDIQKIKNPDIQRAEYQQGDQLGFWNVREYVLFRDEHTCQCCKGKSKDKILNVHHIESRKTGGNAPNNLITLCETCHTGYHKGTVQLPKTIKRGMTFRDATFIGIMRWVFYNKLKEVYRSHGVEVQMTFGYITKNTRIAHHLPKGHCVDARCISGHPDVEPIGEIFYQKKVRCHNRQIHNLTILKNGVRKRNQADYLVKGYRLFDKVSYGNKEYFVFGRRQSGFFDLRDLSGNKVNKGSLSYKKIRFLEPRQSYLCERRRMDTQRMRLIAILP
jgi:hypothetical protein|uniref:NinG recombination protein n=1 Tax=Siphoviridae sp. ctL0q1 TaxID=2825449 RepID=A0A8S5PJF7_9CAUD|nr:MAG TPA: NinG recombination protein [Siphoviridae sp. ctL0q1]